MVIDAHCHYVLSRCPIQPHERFAFELPAADPADPTHWDSCMAPRAFWRPALLGLRWLLALPLNLPPGEELDGRLSEVFDHHLLAPGPIARYVLLAFDAYHAADGTRPPLPTELRHLGSDIYTSNSLVRALCQARPERFLFGASVHPYRPDALDALDEVARAGACLLKWLPLHQNIDVTDPRALEMLRRCGELGLPLLVHYSEEAALATNHPEWRAVDPLLSVLRKLLRSTGTIPTVIVAHAATRVWPWGDPSSHEALLAALTGDFADQPLYADISALTAPTKTGYLKYLAQRQELHHKLIFGTDFPIPPAVWRVRRELGREYAEIAREPSWTQQIARTVRAVGYNEIVLYNAERILRLPRSPTGVQPLHARPHPLPKPSSNAGRDG